MSETKAQTEVSKEYLKNLNIGKALGIWAKRHNVRPIDFSEQMHWRYSYAYSVLRGSKPFGVKSFGTFIMVYGVESLREIFQSAEVKFPEGTHGR